MEKLLSIECNQINIMPKEKIFIGKTLGSGGFGLVEEGKYKSLTLAIKMISNKDDYTKEIGVLQTIKHKSIPLFYGMYSSEKFNHLVIEKIEGATLDKVIEKLELIQDSYNPLEIMIYKLVLAFNITCCLSYMHALGIAHRDVKPNNIMVDMNHQIKLLDFGISKSDINTCSVTNPRCGTLIYLSPEFFPLQYEDEVKVRVNYKSDIWALGLVFNELFSGEKPWSKCITYSSFEVMGMLYQRKDFPVSDQLPLQIVELIKKCTLYDKDERWETLQIKHKLMEIFYSYLTELINETSKKPDYFNSFKNTNYSTENSIEPQKILETRNIIKLDTKAVSTYFLQEDSFKFLSSVHIDSKENKHSKYTFSKESKKLIIIIIIEYTFLKQIELCLAFFVHYTIKTNSIDSCDSPMLSAKNSCVIGSRFNKLKVSNLFCTKEEDSWVSATRKLHNTSKLCFAEEYSLDTYKVTQNSQTVEDEDYELDMKFSTPAFSRLSSISNNCHSTSQSLSFPNLAFDNNKSLEVSSTNMKYTNYLLSYYLSQAKLEERKEKIKFYVIKSIESKDEVRQVLHLFNYSGGKYFVCLMHSCKMTIRVWSIQGFSNKIKVDYNINDIFYFKDYGDHNIFCAFNKSFLYLFVPLKTSYLKKIFVYKDKKLHFTLVRTLSKNENSFNKHLVLLKDANEKLIILFCIEEERIVKRLRFECVPIIFDYIHFNHEDYTLCSAGDEILAVKAYDPELSENSQSLKIIHKYGGLILSAKLQEILVWSDSLYQLFILVSVNKSPKEKHLEIRQITENYCLIRIEFDISIIGIDFFTCRLDHTTTNHYIITKSMNWHQLWKFNCKYDPDIDSVEVYGLSEEKFIYTDEKRQPILHSASNNNSSGSGSFHKEDRSCEVSHASKAESYPSCLSYGSFSSRQDKVSLFSVFNFKKKSKIVIWLQGYEKESQ